MNVSFFRMFLIYLIGLLKNNVHLHFLNIWDNIFLDFLEMHTDMTIFLMPSDFRSKSASFLSFNIFVSDSP